MQCQSTHREHSRRTRPGKSLAALAALAALSILLLAGCSSRGSTATSTVGKAGATSNSRTDNAPGTGKGAPYAAPSPRLAADKGTPAKPGAPAVQGVGVGAKLTRNASLDLKVSNLESAAARVRALATGLQAQVLSEQIGNGAGDPIPQQGETRRSSTPPDSDNQAGSGTLTLSVPADKLDTALDQLAKIGTVLRRNTSSEDVISQLVDTESRLKTMRASVGRVRALMARARDIGQVVALEGELSQREGDLESLESQLSALKNNVERSTVTVSLSTLGDAPVSTTGFMTGLRGGWEAFTASARELVTAVGRVLPFAVFLALVGAPFVWWLRRHRRLPAQSGGV